MSAVHASPPTTASTPTPASTRTAWSKWNTWYKASSVAGSAYVAYIIFVSARWTEPEHPPVPSPFNAIALTGLSLAVIMSFLAGWRLACHARDRRRDEQDREWREGIEKKIDSLIEGLRPQPHTADETTVNLAGRGNTFRPEGRVLYASLMGIYNGPMDVLMEAVGRQVDKGFATMKDEIREFGNQRYYRGYGAAIEDTGNGGTVRPLQPRNGHRPAN